MRYPIEMNWVLLLVAIALFVTWIVLRVALGVPLGVLNLLWMYAIVMFILWLRRGWLDNSLERGATSIRSQKSEGTAQREERRSTSKK